MTDHLDDEQLIDALEGGSAHAASCASCALRLGAIREGVELARSADVPEPPPFFWASFRRDVGRRIEGEGRPARHWPVIFAGLAAAAALTAVLVRPVTTVAPVPAPLPSWSALPEEDPASDVIAGLEPDAELMTEAGCGDPAACVAGLTDAESAELVAQLREELGPGGDL